MAFSRLHALTCSVSLSVSPLTAASLSAAAAGDGFGKQNDEEKERLVYFSPKDRLWSGVLYLVSATLRLMFFISWFADVHLYFLHSQHLHALMFKVTQMFCIKGRLTVCFEQMYSAFQITMCTSQTHARPMSHTKNAKNTTDN